MCLLFAFHKHGTRRAACVTVRLRSMGSRCELFATVVSCFVLAKFVCGATCVILLGVFRSLVGQFFFGCLHLQWLFTMACGCGLCSASFPGGHQVDGLPPASSYEFGIGFEMCFAT